MLQKLTRLLYKVNENIENISGNEESVKFDSSLYVLGNLSGLLVTGIICSR
jgi:hypothetical protein